MALVTKLVVQTTVLVLGLGIMIKIQKLDWTVLGLLGCALIGSGLAIIPYVGHFVAVPVLFVLVARMTHGDPFPNAAVTVIIAYAMMFGANHYALKYLVRGVPIPGFLTPGAMNTTPAVEVAPPDPTTNEPITIVSGESPPVIKGAKSPGKAGVPVAPLTTKEIAQRFSLKTVINNNNNSSLATVHTGVKTYTVGVGETLVMETAGGKQRVTCQTIGDNSVLLVIAGERVQLLLR